MWCNFEWKTSISEASRIMTFPALDTRQFPTWLRYSHIVWGPSTIYINYQNQSYIYKIRKLLGSQVGSMFTLGEGAPQNSPPAASAKSLSLLAVEPICLHVKKPSTASLQRFEWLIARKTVASAPPHGAEEEEAAAASSAMHKATESHLCERRPVGRCCRGPMRKQRRRELSVGFFFVFFFWIFLKKGHRPPFFVLNN